MYLNYSFRVVSVDIKININLYLFRCNFTFFPQIEVNLHQKTGNIFQKCSTFQNRSFFYF